MPNPSSNLPAPAPSARAIITATEGSKVTCKVMFNPKELQVDKSVSWTTGPGAHSENPAQEFKEPQSSSLSVTLYFDTYESGEDVFDTHVKNLELMATIDDSLGRPPLCLFVWGNNFKFQGVVESLSQKYTMFMSDGTRVRCEVGLKMKSASGAAVAKGNNEAGSTGGSSGAKK